jgi:hypothetical protein
MNWPSGLAYLVVRALKRKHTPEDTIFKVELRRMINNIKMKKNADPVELCNQILAVKVWYERPGNAINENEFITTIYSHQCGAANVPRSIDLGTDARQGNKNLRLRHLAVVMDM